MATTTKKTTTKKTTSAPAKKTMGPKRKGKKQYSMVDVKLTGWDGAFRLPKLDFIPLGVSSALSEGDVIKLIAFLHDNTDPETAAAVDDLGGDEAEELMESWAKASGVDLGK